MLLKCLHIFLFLGENTSMPQIYGCSWSPRTLAGGDIIIFRSPVITARCNVRCTKELYATAGMSLEVHLGRAKVTWSPLGKTFCWTLSISQLVQQNQSSPLLKPCSLLQLSAFPFSVANELAWGRQCCSNTTDTETLESHWGPRDVYTREDRVQEQGTGD